LYDAGEHGRQLTSAARDPAAAARRHGPVTRRAQDAAVSPRKHRPRAVPAGPTGWDERDCAALIDELQSLRRSMLEHQARLAPWLEGVDPAQAASAANLAHYLAMRRYDMRRLQDRLSLIGVSSLGRAETHVMANLDKVLGLLHLLTGQHWVPMTADEPVGFRSGRALLDRHAEALFGPPPAERAVRIMVTLPSEAAHDGALVEALVANGMDIARINCAHDGPAAWEAMAERVRRAARRGGRPVRVLMDLAGPKLRTGPLPAAPAVLRIRPQRDDHGRVTAPARLWLHALGAGGGGAEPHLGVDAAWLDALRPGDRIVCDDARDARRSFTVVDKRPDGAWVEVRRTAYLAIETRLQRQRGGRAGPDTAIGDLPPAIPRLLLQRGDKLRLHAVDAVVAAPAAGRRRRPTVAAIGCTLPEALAQVRKGERLWFDDGRLGGVVTRRVARGVEIEITDARDGGEWLAADKGINLPDTRLELPALTAKDIGDLATVARCADLVGLSFAQSAADVRALRARLADHGVPDLGLLLKIETRRGFEHLPEMLFAAMAGPSAGVMIARGDLAVECGYERMAEVQEEILWACEAAHLPVVWATQVLETLARTGRPSRAEITDAAMGERAECVMLNKGPHILDAMRMLDDILRRMQAHQSKKRPLMRALKSWGTLPPAPPPLDSAACSTSTPATPPAPSR
jgi:pyruvate kinase